MDALELLHADHERIDGLFEEYERSGPRAHKTRQRLVERMISELVVHAEIEEQIFYPAVREALPEREAAILESLEEHHLVEVTLSELDGMKPTGERFDAKVRVLIENVRHHVAEEEGTMFPLVSDVLGADVRREIGDAMAQARGRVPTRPHPRSPDEPPGNVLAGAAAGIIDAVRDVLRGR
jgi:hemerythrin superfamily protein